MKISITFSKDELGGLKDGMPGLLDAVRSTMHKYVDEIVDNNEAGNVKNMAVEVDMSDYMAE